MRSLRDRYLSDSQFKNMVDYMASMIQGANFSPSEMREAAILASIIYEERNIHKMIYVEQDIENALDLLHRRVEK